MTCSRTNRRCTVLRLTRLDVTAYDLHNLRWYALGKWLVLLAAVVGALSVLFLIGRRDLLLYAFGVA